MTGTVFSGINNVNTELNIQYVERFEYYYYKIHNLNNALTLLDYIDLIEPVSNLSIDYISSMNAARTSGHSLAFQVLKSAREVSISPVKNNELYTSFFANSLGLLNRLSDLLSVFKGLESLNLNGVDTKTIDDINKLFSGYKLSSRINNELITGVSSHLKTRDMITSSLNGAFNAVKPLASSRNVELVKDYKLDEAIIADHDALFEAWDNLLKNAIEHTYIKWNGVKGGKVVARVTHDSYEQDKRFFCVEIEDNGEGIKDISKFGSKGYTTKPDGNGLGVVSAIDAIEKLNDGSFSVESMPPFFTVLHAGFTKF